MSDCPDSGTACIGLATPASHRSSTAVGRIPAPAHRFDVVDGVIAEAGRSIGHLPNIDLALGALYYIADLPRDAPLFAIARIAGWAAHYDEELGERPVRFRGLARHRRRP